MSSDFTTFGVSVRTFLHRQYFEFDRLHDGSQHREIVHVVRLLSLHLTTNHDMPHFVIRESDEGLLTTFFVEGNKIYKKKKLQCRRKETKFSNY